MVKPPDDSVTRADARSLPFSDEFFDVIVSLDSFYYYGTDDLYLNYLARFVKPGGAIGIAGAGLMQEIDSSIPKHLRDWWTNAILPDQILSVPTQYIEKPLLRTEP
jgi:ubiquinone/menaquinone biosynthesis C-methylase UbiE